MTWLKCFIFLSTLVLVFKKIESEYDTKYDNFYSSSKAEIVINEMNIDDAFESIYTTVITNQQKSLGECSGWIIDSVIDHTISISNNNPLARNNCVKLPKELDHPRKALIDIQNIDDNKCFKWCLVWYLNPADDNRRSITKADKNFAKRPDFKDIKFPVKIRDIHKIEKKIPSALALLIMKIKKNIQSLCIKTCCLLLIGEGEKNIMLLSKTSS